VSVEKRAARVLAEAEELLDQGWIQGTEWDANGNHCMRGAINEVIDNQVTLRVRPGLRKKVLHAAVGATNTVVTKQSSYLGDDTLVSKLCYGMESYNDTSGRTKEQCQGAFRAARRGLLDGRFVFDRHALRAITVQEPKKAKAPALPPAPPEPSYKGVPSFAPSAKKPVSEKKARREKVHA